MKKAAITFALFMSICCFSQKIKLKDGVVTVDAIEWLNYQDCGTFDRTCSLLNKNNEEVIFIKSISVEGAEPVSKANPTGRLHYYEVKFLGYNQMFESNKTQKGILALLYNAKVITESGELDEDKAAMLIEKYGQEFSDKLNRSSSNNNTIIINEAPKPSSGVNINIGR